MTEEERLRSFKYAAGMSAAAVLLMPLSYLIIGPEFTHAGLISYWMKTWMGTHMATTLLLGHAILMLPALFVWCGGFAFLIGYPFYHEGHPRQAAITWPAGYGIYILSGYINDLWLEHVVQAYAQAHGMAYPLVLKLWM